MQAPFATLDPSKMFDGVGDVHLVARDASFGKSLVEHPARRSDERMPLTVFHIAGLFADQNDIRMFRPFAENRLGGVFVEITSLARPSRGAQAFKVSPLGEKFRCGGLLFFPHKLEATTTSRPPLDGSPTRRRCHFDRRKKSFPGFRIGCVSVSDTHRS